MKKQRKLLIVAAIVLVALTAAYFVVSALLPEKPEEEKPALYINKKDTGYYNLVTVEDPVERLVPGVTYASTPMIGFTPAAVACFQKSYAPNRYPWSVVAIAVCPSLLTSVNRSPRRAAPSSPSLCR